MAAFRSPAGMVSAAALAAAAVAAAGGLIDSPRRAPEAPCMGASVINHDFAAFVRATGYATAAERAGRTATWRHPRGPATTLEGRWNLPVANLEPQDAQAYRRWKGGPAQAACAGA